MDAKGLKYFSVYLVQTTFNDAKKNQLLIVVLQLPISRILFFLPLPYLRARMKDISSPLTGAHRQYSINTTRRGSGIINGSYYRSEEAI